MLLATRSTTLAKTTGSELLLCTKRTSCTTMPFLLTSEVVANCVYFQENVGWHVLVRMQTGSERLPGYLI